MTKELTIIDLICLEKLEEGTTINNLGGKINSSFFDAAALAGTMQVKGLVEIKATIGSSTISRTKFGEEVLHKAEEMGKEPLDELDYAILRAVATGTRSFDEISKEINVRSDDLSYHIYKMMKQGYMDYNIRNVKITINLTESGFKLIGYVPKKVEKEKEEARKVPETVEEELEETIIRGEDVTSTMPIPKEPAKLTRMQRMKAKSAYYLKIIIPILIIIVIILILAKVLAII